MAAPSYTTDLTTISECETTTGFSQIGASGNINIGAGVDFAIQGVNAVDAKLNIKVSGMAFTGATITNVAGLHFFAWIFIGTPGIADIKANGGKQMCIGTSDTDFMSYYVDGKDTQPEGGHKCYVARYTTVATATIVKTGNPTANPATTGAIMASIGNSKGSNFGLDVMRYGSGGFVVAGELIAAGDGSDDPASFTGFAALNDSTANRWGILAGSPGGYVLQGTFAIGQDNTGTPTLCRFKESNKQIVIEDTEYSTTDFTKIIIDHASTYVELDGITFLSLGANNPGQFLVNNASSDVNLNAVTFENTGITQLNAGTTADFTTWRTTDQITQNSAALNNCVISNNTATSAIIADDLDNITSTDFVSSGTGHAISVPSGITNVTITSTDNTYDGYAVVDGSTGNEAIYFEATTGAITLIQSGGTTPSIRTAGAIITLVDNPVITKVTVQDIDTKDLIQNARVYLVAEPGGPLPPGTEIINESTSVSGEVIDISTYSSPQPVSGRVRKSTSPILYKTSAILGEINNINGLDIVILMVRDS